MDLINITTPLNLVIPNIYTVHTASYLLRLVILSVHCESGHLENTISRSTIAPISSMRSWSSDVPPPRRLAEPRRMCSRLAPYVHLTVNGDLRILDPEQPLYIRTRGTWVPNPLYLHKFDTREEGKGTM